MKLSKLFFLFLLFIPLALAATTVRVDNYQALQAVTITGMCTNSGPEVGLQASLEGNTVWFDQVTAVNNQYTASFYPPQTGTYTIYSACSGDSAVTTTSCVGSSCQAKEEITDEGTPDDGTTPPSDTSISDSTPSGGVVPKGSSGDSTSSGVAGVCQESWICGPWSNCINGAQTRQCNDFYSCGTFIQVPIMQQSCFGTGGQPQIPTGAPLPVVQEEKSFWEKYLGWLISIPLVLILIVILILLYLHHKRKKQVVYNTDELKNWISQEQAAGTSKEDIRGILKDKTGWSEEEIEQAFGELGGASTENTSVKKKK